MSEFVLRGAAAPAQLYLDRALERWGAAGGGSGVSVGSGSSGGRWGRGGLPGLLLHCMRDNPNRIFMIDEPTGASYSNGEVVKRASRVSRAIARAAGARRGEEAAGDGGGRVRVVVMMKNHVELAAVYFGAMASGALPLLQDAEATAVELQLFIKLLKPHLIFCETWAREVVYQALRATGLTADVIVAAGGGGEAGAAEAAEAAEATLANFTEGCCEDWGDDVLAAAAPGDAVLMMPTSGSTGLPKAVLLTHEGLIAHLPFLWMHHERFPCPERRALLLSTSQWLTHTLVFTSAPVFQVPLVTSARPTSPRYVLDMIEQQQVTWLLTGPPMLAGLASELQAGAGAGVGTAPRSLCALRTLLVTGSPPPAEAVQIVKSKMIEGVVLNGYGMSEAQGFVAIPRHDTPPGSIGKIINILDYKIVDDNGKECEPNEPGELLLKSERVVFKGYYKNEEAYKEAVPGGWYRTGDLVRQDDEGNIFFLQRLKFVFKSNNCQVSPEEVESVVCSVAGVAQALVGGTARGPAALVVAPARDPGLADRIHAAVSILRDYKRLHGGIAFVPALPTTRSGKLERRACQQLLDSLL